MTRKRQGRWGTIVLTAVFCASVPRPAHAENKELPEMKEANAQAGAEPAVEQPVLPQVRYEAEALRDPFPPPLEKKDAQKKVGMEGQANKTTAVEITPPKLTIQGIIWGGALSQAVINSKVCKVGDSVDEARITDISRDGIDILYKDREFHVAYPPVDQQKKSENTAKGGSSAQ